MTTEYYKGLTDGIIGLLLSEEIYISQEKLFNDDVVKKSENYWEVNLKWCIGYKEPNFKGDRLQPPDDDMPVYKKVKLTFTDETKIVEIIKELRTALEEIQNAKEPEIIEHNNSDELYDELNNK